MARALDGHVVEGAEVVGRIVPNNSVESIDVVAAAIAEVRPAVVVMLGEYGGRAMLTVERLAQNLNDSTRYDLADNRGVRLQGEPTVPDGPAAYYATVPCGRWSSQCSAAGIPADISDTAATFGCNHLMYGVLHQLPPRSCRFAPVGSICRICRAWRRWRRTWRTQHVGRNGDRGRRSRPGGRNHPRPRHRRTDRLAASDLGRGGRRGPEEGFAAIYAARLGPNTRETHGIGGKTKRPPAPAHRRPVNSPPSAQVPESAETGALRPR